MNKNLSLAANLVCIAVGMLALAFASVPLYRLFCQTTGYDGTTQTASQAPTQVLGRVFTVRFNADIAPTLPWEFKPGTTQLQVRVGQQQMTRFMAKNLTGEKLTGRAVYNVTPFAAGAYFTKIACFCFTEQTLKPHQQVTMPVVFFIDPKVMDDPEMKNVSTITLSYTFFPVKTETKH